MKSLDIYFSFDQITWKSENMICSQFFVANFMSQTLGLNLRGQVNLKMSIIFSFSSKCTPSPPPHYCVQSAKQYQRPQKSKSQSRIALWTKKSFWQDLKLNKNRKKRIKICFMKTSMLCLSPIKKMLLIKAFPNLTCKSQNEVNLTNDLLFSNQI